MKRLTSKQLREIASKIEGPRPGLWILPPYRRTRTKTGPESIVVRTYSEVTAKPRSGGDFWDDLVRVQLPAAVLALSTINILLARFTRRLDLHQALSEKFLHSDLRSKPEPFEPGRRPDYVLIFNRIGVLATLKGLIGVPKDAGEKEVYNDHQIGRLILRANDFITSTKFRQPDKVLDDLDLAVELLPTWELSNERDLAYGLTRTYLLVTRHLAGTDSTVTTLRDRVGLDPTALRYNGVPLEDFIAVIFGLYSHVLNMDPPQLFQGLIHCAIESKTFLAQTGFPQQLFDTFLNHRSIPLDALRHEIASGKPWEKKRSTKLIESDDFATDFLAFRKHPLIDLENGKHLIIDIQFVAEMLFTGLFFEILFSLKPGKREDFLSLWGRLFELYIWELLGDFYPRQASILQTDISFSGGQIDALLDFGPYVVILEFKFLLLPHDVKYSRDSSRFAQELRLKLVENERGEPKALRQLARGIQAIRDGKVKTALKQDKPLYPLVVVYEPSLESFGINSFLNTEFQRILATIGGDANVKPLTVMSVQELEILLAQTSVGHVTWSEVLEARFDGKRVRATSTHQTLYDILKTKSKEFGRNAFLLRNFEEIYKTIEKRYHTGGQPEVSFP